jgi:hypothetical protein
MLELFFTKENLLADAENELLSAVNAGQGFFTVFHAPHLLAAAQFASKVCAAALARLDASGRYPATAEHGQRLRAGSLSKGSLRNLSSLFPWCIGRPTSKLFDLLQSSRQHLQPF